MRTPAGEDDVDLVLFDVGGTIYDDDCYAQALLAATRELAGEVDEHEFWEVYDSQREAARGRLREVIARRFIPGGDGKRLHSAAERHWRCASSALYPDVEPTLTALAGRYRLGLVASSPAHVVDALRRDGLAGTASGARP